MTVKIKLSELDKLSKEELVAMANHVQKIKQSQKTKTQERYLENAHQFQIEFHKNQKRIRCFLGSNRSGKTTAGVNEFIWQNLGTHPFRKCRTPIKSAIVAQDYENHVKNVLEKKIEEWAPLGAVRDREKTQTGALKKIIWASGSTTDIYSHDQAQKVFESSDYDCIWFDEPPPKSIFTALFRSLVDRGGFAFITATPIVEPWLYAYFKQSEQDPESMWWFTFVEMEANARNLGQGDVALGLKRIADFASTLDPEERIARLKGRFMVMEGLIFKSWGRKTHLIKPFDWPKEWPIYESIDPHPRKPAGVSWVGLTENGSKVLLQSGYLEGDSYELAHEILAWRERLPIKDNAKPYIVRTLIDNSSNAPMTGASRTNMTRERVSVREEIENIIGPKGAGGPRVECPSKSVAGKIDALKQWLTVRPRGEIPRERPDFFVYDAPENEDFIEEIENYIWAKYKNREQGDYKDRPVKRDDDIIDSVMQVALTLKDSTLKQQEPHQIAQGFGTYGRR
jgi:hypothetical protein